MKNSKNDILAGQLGNLRFQRLFRAPRLKACVSMCTCRPRKMGCTPYLGPSSILWLVSSPPCSGSQNTARALGLEHKISAKLLIWKYAALLPLFC